MWKNYNFTGKRGIITTITVLAGLTFGLMVFGKVIWPDPTDSMAQETRREQDSEYTWKTLTSVLRGDEYHIPPTLFVKGRSKSGKDILFTIERLTTGERITITCPIPNVIPPKTLTIYACKDHCMPSEAGYTPRIDIPKKCCQVRYWWMADVDADIVKGKGYVLTIQPTYLGWMVSHLTSAQTLWISTFDYKPEETFTFRVAGFAEKLDTLY